jgi:hypothetical protein
MNCCKNIQSFVRSVASFSIVDYFQHFVENQSVKKSLLIKFYETHKPTASHGLDGDEFSARFYDDCQLSATQRLVLALRDVVDF